MNFELSNFIAELLIRFIGIERSQMISYWLNAKAELKGLKY